MIRLMLMLLLLAQPACAQEAMRRFGPDDATVVLKVRSTTDTEIFAPTVAAYLATAPKVAIEYEQWGSNDLFALSARECANAAPGADLVISSAVHHMVKLVNDACAARYRSAQTALLPPDLRWRDEVWGITREPAVIVYNRALVPPGDVPNTRFDLLDLLRPEASPYAGKVATYDIETSGLGFLFAFADSQEASTFGALMEAFGRSGAIATCCSAEIIDGVADGRYLMAYNVLGSYAMSEVALNPDLGIVLPADYTLVLARAAILPRRATQRPEAAAFLDFILSSQGQATLSASHLILAPASDDNQPGTTLRPIALKPSLLVALDSHKRAAFVRRWRETFAN